jgi:hypothetical protein
LGGRLASQSIVDDNKRLGDVGSCRRLAASADVGACGDGRLGATASTTRLGVR